MGNMIGIFHDNQIINHNCYMIKYQIVLIQSVVIFVKENWTHLRTLRSVMSISVSPEKLYLHEIKDTYIWKRYLSCTYCAMYTTHWHYNYVIMSATVSQITGVSIVCLTVCSGTDQRKHQSSASRAFVKGIHRWPVDSPHKGPVTQKMFPFDDVVTEMGHIIMMSEMASNHLAT